MFPVVTTPHFEVAVRRIAQRQFFWDSESPEQGLKKSLVAALATVRMFPEAYPRTGKVRRRFTFEHRSVPYTVLFTFDGERVVLHDIHFARSAGAATWLTE